MLYITEKNVKEGDTMKNKKETKETGWNLDNSYARLPESFFPPLAQPL